MTDSNISELHRLIINAMNSHTTSFDELREDIIRLRYRVEALKSVVEYNEKRLEQETMKKTEGKNDLGQPSE